MNYIILDMEWNQALSKEKTVRRPVVLNGEIIQIGAVKVDENFRFTDTFKINVKPKFYKIMNPYVKEITGISSEDLAGGESFPSAYKRFAKWCGRDFRFMIWGFDDIGILLDNIKLHSLDKKQLGADFEKNYINLQLIFKKQTDGKQLQCALSAAAEKLGIEIDLKVHDAANDAFLTYEVMHKLDMTRGVAEYNELRAASAGIPIFKETVRSIGDPKNMLEDRKVSEFRCPICGGKLKIGIWLFSNGRNCKNIGECEKDERKFLLKIKAVGVKGKNGAEFSAVRSVYDLSSAEEQKYLLRIKRRSETGGKKENRVKKEGTKNEKNDNDRP